MINSGTSSEFPVIICSYIMMA